MADPETNYEIGRMSVLVERCDKFGQALWLVCANRRQSERFRGTSAVAWCNTREHAQDLARMLAGVEITREGVAIWPDRRTEPEHSLDCNYDPRPCSCGAERGLCIGCSGKRYRLATRDDDERAVERCDMCSEHMTDDEAIVLAGEEGIQWLLGDLSKPPEPEAHPLDRYLIRRLVEWSRMMGEFESPIWDEARAFLRDTEPNEPDEPLLKPDELGD